MKAFTLLSVLAACAGSAYAGGISGSGLVVLNPSASGALTMTGNSTIFVPTHAVYVNSSSSSAVRTVGNASLDVPDVYICGGFSFSSNSGCTGAVHVSCVAYSNPMSAFAFPSAAGMSSHAAVSIGAGQNQTLQPGYYPNGISITGNSSVVFSPGVYLVGNKFKITAGSISGQGVSIVMLNGALSIAGASSLVLTPPSDGAMAGMVICQPSSNSSNMSLAGGSGTSVSGAIYLPNGVLSLVGTSSLEADGPLFGDLVVADRVSLTGNGAVKIGHPEMTAISLPHLPLAD